MSRPNQKKIPTEATGGGLFQAFAKLDIGDLPAGPPSPPPAETAVSRSPSSGAPIPKKLGRVVLRRETAHRGGKCVVVVDGFSPSLDDAFLQALSKRLRAACGCGGAIKDRAIELQGEQVPRIRELLVAEGFQVAGVG